MRPLFRGEKRFDGLKDDLRAYTRLGEITTVDSEAGVITLKWLDHIGGRDRVVITQSDQGSWSMPTVGTVVVVAFDVRDQARIVRYMPLGYKKQHQDQKIRRLYPGEKLWQSTSSEEGMGAEIYMDQDGNILLYTATGNYIELVRDTNSVSVVCSNWIVESDAGKLVSGVVKRNLTSGGYQQTTIITDDGTNVLGDSNKALVEHRLRVVETADNVPGTDGIDNPLVEVVYGNVVASDGSIETSSQDTQLALKVKVTKGANSAVVTIDKDGNIKVTTNNTAELAGNQIIVTSDDIKLGSSEASQYIVLDQYLTNWWNNTVLPKLNLRTGNLGLPLQYLNLTLAEDTIRSKKVRSQ